MNKNIEKIVGDNLLNEHTIEDIENVLKSNDSVMLYFSGEYCNVCKSLKPKIQSAFTTNLPKIKQIYINIEENPKIASKYGIFSVPSICVYFEAKEFSRKARLISVDGLIQDLARPYNLFFK